MTHGARYQFFGRNYQDRGSSRAHLKSIVKGSILPASLKGGERCSSTKRFSPLAPRLPCSRQASQATHNVSGIWDQVAHVRWVQVVVCRWVLVVVCRWVQAAVCRWVLVVVCRWVLVVVCRWVLVAVCRWVLVVVCRWVQAAVSRWVQAAVSRWVQAAVSRWVLILGVASLVTRARQSGMSDTRWPRTETGSLSPLRKVTAGDRPSIADRQRSHDALLGATGGLAGAGWV
jgi:hypothetical protein